MLPQLLQHARRVGRQIVKVVALHRELVLGVALAAADADVLRRPADRASRPGTRASLRPQPGDDLRRRARSARRVASAR